MLFCLLPFASFLYFYLYLFLDSYLSYGSFFCTKTLLLKETWKGRVLFHFAVHHWVSQGRELEVRNWYRAHEGMLLTDLLLMTFPACFFVVPGITHSVWQYVEWVRPQQSFRRKLSLSCSQANLVEIFSQLHFLLFSSFKTTLTCINFSLKTNQHSSVLCY